MSNEAWKFWGIILLVIFCRLCAGKMDRGRIRDYFRQRRCRLLHSEWARFGTGWSGEGSERLYKIQYLDHEGNRHQAICKTSMMTGVFLNDDRIVSYAKPPEPAAASPSFAELERENRELRQEIERLKSRRG